MAQLNVLDLLERRVSVLLNIPEEDVYKVIRHKWKSCHEATDKFTSVEDSGLGKFLIRPKKITKRLERLNKMIDNCVNSLKKEDITLTHRKKLESIIERSTAEKEYLETKI